MIESSRAGTLSTIGLMVCSFVGCGGDNSQAIVDDRHAIEARILQDEEITADEVQLFTPALKDVLIELQERGASFEIVEGVGLQLFSLDARATGVVASVEYEDFSRGESPGQTVTRITIESGSKTIHATIPDRLAVEKGQQIDIEGDRIVVVNGMADFLSGGPSPATLFERYDNLVDLLSGESPIVARSVELDGVSKYNGALTAEIQSQSKQDENWRKLISSLP